MPILSAIACTGINCGEGNWCVLCNGFGWLWNDGKKPTYCPGGGKSPVKKDPETHACGRREGMCRGCDRKDADIGTQVDLMRTAQIRRNNNIVSVGP